MGGRRGDGRWRPVGYHRALIDLLRELRQRSGTRSFREIAKRSEASPGHVSDVVNGRKIPSGDMAAAIAEALGGDTHEQMRARTYAENAAEDAARDRGPVQASIRRGAGRCAYLEQVRRIAPEVLYDRDAELAELATFCTAADHGPYVWWQAEAWAGKSALLSWFVLHPPAGVRVVSFFITARLPDQGDRSAFIDAVSSQLDEVPGQPLSGQVPGAMREAYLLHSLRAAAEASRRRGQRLILVIDGLDEDQGVVAGPDAHSIAGLLPQRPPGEMRIVVAGRPHPAIPADVLDGHPLRNPAVVRVLDRSVHAQGSRRR